MKTYTKDELASILAAHREWLNGSGGERADLSGANLSGANLAWANLAGADLAEANLSGADLSGANLAWANLAGADLAEANLAEANLAWANLAGANLSRANLAGADLAEANLAWANLAGADLAWANLAGGVTWEQYLAEVVPAFLTGGGKTLAEVLATGCWECHSWENCPTHAAYGVSRLEDVPVQWRLEASRFIELFDAKAIPMPTVEAK